MKKTVNNTDREQWTIGFLCGTLFDLYHTMMFKAIDAAAKEKNLSLVVFVGNSLRSQYFDQLQKNAIYNHVSSNTIDGIISLSGILGNHISFEPLIDFYSRFSDIPIISIGVKIKGMPSILVDNEKGMEDLLSHLIEKHKARRIAFIRGPEGNPEAEVCFSVYKKVLKRYKIPFDPDLIAPGDFTILAGTNAVSLLLDKRKVTFDALVSSNDRMALSAIEALNKRGIRVPENVAVTGFDNIPKSSCCIPPLTTVSQPLYRMGKEAVHLLLSIFNGNVPPEKKILRTRFVVRRSCGCPEIEWHTHPCSRKDKKIPVQKNLSPEQIIITAISNKVDNFDFISTLSKKELRIWIHSLLEAFKKGLKKKEFSEFTLVLDTMFYEFRNRNQDTSFWNIIINSICDYVQSSVQNPDDRNLLDNLRVHIFEMLGKAINRTKEYENITFQEQSIELYGITQELLTGFKLDSMKKVILESIPRIGLKSCFIFLYKINEYNEVNPEYSRLVVAYPICKEADELEGKGYYPSHKIISRTLKIFPGIHTFVIMSINLKNEILGYCVCEHGSENLFVYENFIVQLSSVLKEIRIIEQKVVHTHKLEQEVKESTTAPEKTTHQLNLERDERKKTEEALCVAQEQALVTLKSIGDGVITTDTKGIITYLNPVSEKLTGWLNNDAVGKPLDEVLKVVYRFSDLLVDHPVDIALNNDKGFKISGSIVLKNKNLHEYEIEESISPIRNFNNNVIGVVIIIRNVSETQRMTRELFYQRTHDQLTGLINRIRFEELVKEAFEGLLTETNEHCLCFLDIDSFRIINDACGHAAGDELIKKVVLLLRGCIRQSDVLARLGGDQFGLLLISCPFSRAKELAESILTATNGYTFVWKDTNYRVRISIGLVYIDSYSENISHALTAVNFACYLAKKKGGNQLHIYQADDEDSVKYKSEMQYIPYITKAIKDDRFCIYKQVIRPIGYGIPDNDHYEILIRMKDDDGNLISPSSFLQIAERYSLMPEIDRWVVEKLFSSYKVDYYETPDKAYAKYSINISGVTLNDEKFLQFIIDKLNQYKIPPYMICFEITETAAISNFSQVILFIKELKKIGCFFSLDDFGSGWASFNYLKLLPVDFLKIDGSFVKEIACNPLDYVFVQTMNHIGHVIGLKTIAEYVENDDIIERLKKIGVDYAQGYGISKPEPFFN